VVLDDAAQFLGGTAAALCCAWTSRHRTGVERTWRRFMAVGMGGWSVGQLIWSWYQLFAKPPLPCPSWADLGYLTLPVFGVLALSTIAVDSLVGYRREAGRRTRDELAGGSALSSAYLAPLRQAPRLWVGV